MMNPTMSQMPDVLKFEKKELDDFGSEGGDDEEGDDFDDDAGDEDEW